jgi:hypothetical protein
MPAHMGPRYTAAVRFASRASGQSGVHFHRLRWPSGWAKKRSSVSTMSSAVRGGARTRWQLVLLRSLRLSRIRARKHEADFQLAYGVLRLAERIRFSKFSSLVKRCSQGSFLFACNGKCPKSRRFFTPDTSGKVLALCGKLKKVISQIIPFLAPKTTGAGEGEPDLPDCAGQPGSSRYLTCRMNRSSR